MDKSKSADHSGSHSGSRALLYVRFCFYPFCGHTSTKAACSEHMILNDNRRLKFQPEVSMRLSSQRKDHDPSEDREQVKEA